MPLNSSSRPNRSISHGYLLFLTLFSFLVFTSLSIFPLQEGHCAQVTLAWDADSLSDLAGYKIYYGTASGNYQWNVDAGNVTTHTISDLTIGATYYAAATAYTAGGLESTYSNEVMFTVPSCTYAISASNASFAASGGTGSVNITAPSYCNWTISSSIPWITVSTGSGLGSGMISYSVSSNKDTTSRTASLTIAGKVFTVTEAGKGQTMYTITVSAGAGGSISPSGQVAVQPGAVQAFTITPNTGDTITDVKVDGVSQGAVNSYSFSNIQANHTITASFTASTNITYSGASSPLNTHITIKNDFNGDGEVDLLWRNKVSGAVGVWLMNGTQTISAQMINSGVDLNWEIAGTGDFNNDGQTDILWRNKTTGDVGFWLMNGTAISNTLVPYAGVDLNWEIAGTGDFNGDGQTDVLWRNKVSGAVGVWLMNGTQTISAQVINSGVDLNWEIAGTGDFNNDGQTDILWRNKTTGDVGFWLMNGTAISSTLVPYAGVDLNWEIAGTGDFNGDGQTDILWRNKATGDVGFWLMNGTAISSTIVPYAGVDLNWIPIAR